MRSFFLLALVAPFAAAQVASSDSPTAAPVPTDATTTAPFTPTSSLPIGTGTGGNSTGGGSSGGNVSTLSGPPDVLLQVPELSVGRIELNVEKLSADLNLNAKVAGLVNINAGVQVSVEKVNITIADVEAELELQVRLGHLVDIVNRVFDSLDLNPLLISAIGNVTDLIGDVIGAVDGLLGSITQGGNTINFLVDNLGNIVQDVVGAAGSNPVSSIVGNFRDNMTFTGVAETLKNGLVKKEFSYSPLNSLVDIIFNTAGQVVQATVQKKNGGGGTSTSSAATSTPTASAAARRR